jgi:peptidyl-prolyl cis-trans isomerase SurA
LIDASWGISGLGPVQIDGFTSSFVIVKGILSPEPKKLDETRGLVTSDYQEYLETEWLKSLKEKYPVSVNSELLKQINP